MNIIIVGCGKIGATLADQLSRESYDVTVIDQDRERLQAVIDSSDVIGCAGNGTSFQLLQEAGIANADVLIAVTGQDEVNLLCCVIAKQTGHDIATIARVQDFTYFKESAYLRARLGISMIINPELTAATEISRLLRTPEAIEISTFAGGRTELLTFSPGPRSVLIGMPLAQMNRRLRTQVLVCAVERGQDVHIPKGDFVFQAGDVISIVGAPKETSLFFQKIGMAAGQVHDVFLIGGGRISHYLATQLAAMNLSVKILEADEQRCEYLSEHLPSAMVIHGSSLNRDLLLEEGLAQAQSVVSATGMDVENMMLSMLTSIYNPSARLVTKLSRPPFEEVLRRMELGSVVCPKELLASQILQYIRAMENSRGSNVETLYRILGGQVEALEFHIQSPSPVLDTPLQDLDIRPDVLVCAIVRKGRVFNPRGTDRLLMHDNVVVVTSRSGLSDITDILRGRAASRLSRESHLESSR